MNMITLNLQKILKLVLQCIKKKKIIYKNFDILAFICTGHQKSAVTLRNRNHVDYAQSLFFGHEFHHVLLCPEKQDMTPLY